MLLVKHFSRREHFSLFMQLQVLSLVLVGGSRTVLLCSLMIDFTFGIHLKHIFTLFRLKSLCSLWCGGKCLSISLRNVLPIFVITDLLNGELNQMIFLFRCLRWVLFRGGSRINFRVLQNFTKQIEHRNDVICRKIIDSARSKKVQF